MRERQRSYWEYTLTPFITMGALTKAFDNARADLTAVGLLYDGLYLDHIECLRSPLPAGARGTCGWVYDGGVTPIQAWVGFEPGVIYIPLNAPVRSRTPGQTLTDVIRHEFAHAWYWLDDAHVDGSWFRRAFGARYHQEERVACDEYDPAQYVSPYAMTRPKEDFAETFMTYLRCRRSLARFQGREGVFSKLMAVDDAVRRAAARRVDRVRPG